MTDQARPRLRAGKLHPLPASDEEARVRLAEANLQVAKIKDQLDDPNRICDFLHAGDYDRWRGVAKRAMREFREEVRQTEAWLADREATALGLLRELRSLVESIEDLDPAEEALVARVDALLSPKKESPVP